jgi:hypothetical protein
MKAFTDLAIAAGLITLTEEDIVLRQKGPIVVSIDVTRASGLITFNVPASFGTSTVVIGSGVSLGSTVVLRQGTKTATTIPVTVHDAADDSAIDLSSGAHGIDFCLLELV